MATIGKLIQEAEKIQIWKKKQWGLESESNEKKDTESEGMIGGGGVEGRGRK